MTAQKPNYLTTGIIGPNLITVGLWEYAVMFTGYPVLDEAGTTASSDLQVCRRQRTTAPGGTGIWNVHKMTGAEATALSLPNTDGDSHKWCALMIGGDERMHVWANMHADPYPQPAGAFTAPENGLHYAVSTQSVANVWPPTFVKGFLPQQAPANSYPTAARFQTNELVLLLRDGPLDAAANPPLANGRGDSGSGRSNASIWMMPADGSAWGNKRMMFQGVKAGGTVNGLPLGGAVGYFEPDDDTNYGPYWTNLLVEPAGSVHPGRLHLAWIWRQIPIAADGTRSVNILPSYGYSDDKGATWRAIDGTLLTFPIGPWDGNNLACRTGLLHPTGVQSNGQSWDAQGYLNWGGICVDPATGFPHMAVSQNPWFHMWWDGTIWRQASITGLPRAVKLGGFNITSRMSCYWIKDAMWVLTNAVTPGERHLRLFRVDGNRSVRLGPEIQNATPSTHGPGSGGLWEAHADPEAVRLFGVIHTLMPDGDAPRVFTFADNHRTRLYTGAPPYDPTFWDTIDNTGATDVTDAINGFINAQAPGATITFKPGTYRIDGSLTIASKNGFIFVGTGVTLIQPYCGTITDGTISGGTNFHSDDATFTPRITGATLAAASTAIIPAGTTVTYVDAHNVTLSAAGTNGAVASATINPQFTMANSRNRYFWDVSFGGAHSWSGFTMLGANPFAGLGDNAYSDSFEAQHAWNLGGVRGFEISDCTVSDIWGDFVYMTCPGGVGNRVCTDGRIHDNTFLRNGRQGCSNQGGINIRYDHNNVDQIRRAFFDLEPNGENQIIAGMEIDNNVFGSNRLLFIAASGGTHPSASQRDINVHNNVSNRPYAIEWHGEPFVDAGTVSALPACTYVINGPGDHRLVAAGNGAFPVIDDVTLAANGRVMVKNQVDLSQHGPYRLLIVGDGSTPWQLQRCDDFASVNSIVEGAYLYATGGTGNIDRAMVMHPKGSVDPNAPISGGNPFVVGTSQITVTSMPGTGPGTEPVVAVPGAPGATGPIPYALSRNRLAVVNNTATQAGGNPVTNCVIELMYITDATVTGNTQPLQDSGTVLVDLNKCRGTNVVSGNTITVGGQSRTR